MNKKTIYKTSSAIAGILGVTLLLTSCTPTEEITPSPETSVSSETTPEATVAPAKQANPSDYTVTGELGVEPKIVLNPESGNVTELYTATLTPGTGEQTVQPGDTVTVHYVGMGAVSKKIFDTSWAINQTATFPLDQVIPGWSEGLVGMKVGERRLLVIPGEKAYGEISPTPEIGNNETLVFVVDLISIP